jgi:hypothetical protein
MAVEDSLDIFGSDPFGRDYLYGLSTGRERLGLQPPPQGLQLDTRPYDRMQATPRGFTSGLFSDLLGGTFNMPSMPRTGIPSLDLLSPNMNLLNRLSFGDPQKTAERISYGEPLSTGSGMTLRPKDETVGAALTVAPFIGNAARFGARTVRAGARMVGQGMAENAAMGRPNLPSMFAEPRSSLFAVEPNPSMAAADESSAMRQQLTGKMQALLAQKKVATSAVEVGAINQQIGELQARFKSLPAVGRVAREVVAPQITAPVSDLGFYSAAEQAAMNLERSKGTGQSFLNDLMNAPDVKKDELSWIGLDDFLKDKPNVTKQEVQDFIGQNKVDLQEVRLGESPIEDPIGIAQRKAVFDKYEPEIQQLYSELDNITAQKRNALKLANAKYDEMLYQLNKDGYMPTAQDYESFNLAERELTQANRMQNDDIDIRNRLGKIQNMRDAEADAAYVVPETMPTKYSKYQLAGGKNYREILLKLPQKETRTPNMIEYEKLGQQMFGGALNPTERARLDELENLLSREERSMALSGGKSKTSVYQSSHFNEPNILAHMRVNDRIDADGKKMLLVEEIQSDWHQAGRESGYAPKNAEAQLAASRDRMAERSNEIRRISNRMAELNDSQLDEFNALAQERQRLQDLQGEETDWGNRIYDAKNSGVPDAPFKDTWYQLSLKRILKYAADNGYERVGLTTGKQQVDRFSNELRQNVDEITFQTGLKLTPSEAAELQALRQQQTIMTGTERARYEYLSSNEGEYVGKGETKIKAFKGSKPTFSGTVKDGKFIDGQAQGKTVEEVLGKTMAKQIAEKQTGVLKGDNLTVGGEGMKAYYDEIYPKFLEKYGKKWDAGVGETEIKTGQRIQLFGVGKIKTGNEKVRYIDITPKMKEGVKKGQPLAAAEQTPEMLASGGLDYADPFKNPLLESTIG